MVESYGVAKDPQDVGIYTGMLMTMVSVGNIFTNLLWGILSDRVGRKPCLVISVLSTSVTELLLGSTRSFPTACVQLVAFGAFHGTPVLVKSSVAEVCDRTNQSKGFALLVFCWGLGSIFGPLIGGVLAFPCEREGVSAILPQTFCTYPFLLPLAFTTLYHFGLSIAVCFLQETVKTAASDNKSVQHHGGNAHGANGMHGAKGASGASGSHGAGPAAMESGVDIEAADAEPYSHVQAPPRAHAKKLTAHKNLTLPSQFHRSNKPTVGQPASVAGDASGADERENDQVFTFDIIEASSPMWQNHLTPRYTPPRVPTPRPPPGSERQWDAVGVVVLFGSVMFVQFDGETLLSIYSAAPEQVGGLGYDPKTMGIAGGVTGVCVLAFTILAISKLARSLGPLNCIRIGFLVSIPIWISTPMVGWLNAGWPSVKLGALLLLRMVRSAIGCMAFAGSMMVISNSAQAHNMGMVTGLGDTLAALFTIIAPALAGWLWTVFSVTTFAGHECVPWLVLIVLCGLMSGLAGMLPARLNVSRI